MKTKSPVPHFLSVILALGLLAGCEKPSVSAQHDGETVTVSTFSGSKEGYSDGIGNTARFFWPFDITADVAGNFYVADAGNHRIRKITPAGEVSSIAGNGEKGFTDGIGGAAQFEYPNGITRDTAGNLYLADSGNHSIRRITPAGEVTTIAGSGKSGFADGIGTAAWFNSPHGITADAAGSLYVVDSGNNRIRRITSAGEVSTIAGSDEKGFADGAGAAARFNRPAGITMDAEGNLYVVDYGNNRIRKITSAGEVSTIAGNEAGGFANGIGGAARFNRPAAIAIDTTGNLYVTDLGNHRIRKITPAGEVSTIAGSTDGFADGIGRAAMFNAPVGIMIDAAGNLYVADSHNNRIRKIVK